MSDEIDDTELPLPRVVFTEGSITLPAGYEDRTHNVLVPANPQTQPNLSIARDWMKDGETIEQYFERQLGRLRSHLSSHKVLHRGELTLPLTPKSDSSEAESSSNAAVHGLYVDASHRNGKLLVYQRQAVFEVAPARVLIFTASGANLGERFEQLWREWLSSYEPPMSTNDNNPSPDAPDA